jgi:DNA mismatch repair protein MutS2
VGEEHIDYDKHLQDIARDKRYWENKRQQIRQKEKTLEERIAQYEEQMSGIKQKKRELLEEARQQAADLLQQSNATIERTIREIKEAKADKERTKAARKKVEALKEKVKNQESKAESQESRAKSQESKVKSTKTKVEMNGKRVLKDFSELRAIGKQMAKEAPQTPSKTISNTTVRNTVRQRTLAFERTLDLRGMRIDEATERLIAYMDDALMVGAGEVTILHGTGTGALKQLTRDYLSDINRQRHKRGQVPLEYGDGDVNHGGAGLTIVNL